MFSILELPYVRRASGILLGMVIGNVLRQVVYRVFLHPLTAFPGPRIAAATKLYKAYVECIQQRSWHETLEELHRQYGSVVRVGPDELHFAQPQAYHDIYNNKNRWHKEKSLYHGFGEDRSSFGFLHPDEARERREIVGRMMSPRAIETAYGLLLEKVTALCDTFQEYASKNKAVDFFWAYRCMTIDIITYLAYGRSVDALNSPGFKAPIIEAMEASTPVFVRFKHAHWYMKMIINCPPAISKVVSPQTAGLVNLQQIIRKQINQLVEHPEALDHLPHQMTMYHQLLSKEARQANTAPSPGSLYEESQALMFAGGDTVGQTLMVGTFHMIQREPQVYARLKQELSGAWPSLPSVPSLRDLEKLPYLTAVIKESLRMNSGVITGLPRIVPPGGASIVGQTIPEGTIVSCGSTFVHFDPSIFPEPHKFKPERWMGDSSLNHWLVSFSQGPRMCLGINLAWAELRLAFAHTFRRFDITPTEDSAKDLPMREAFLPCYYGPHVMARLTTAS